MSRSFAGPGTDQPFGITAGPDGALWFANSGNNTIGRITISGTVTSYKGTNIDGPYDITPGPDGALWFTNAFNNTIGRTVGLVPIPATGGWRNAIEVPGIAAGNSQNTAAVNAVSCGSAGSCSAGGYYHDDSGHAQAFVVSEAGGTWGSSKEVPGTGTLNKGGGAQVSAVSCASQANCAAAGTYVDGSGDIQVFAATQSGGTWGQAQELPGLSALNQGGAAEVLTLSCSSPGNCAAGGDYQDGSLNPQAFVADEQDGTWQNAIAVPGSIAANTADAAQVNSVSCPADGECVAGGFYSDSGGTHGFVATEHNGSWNTLTEVTGLAALNTGGDAQVTSVSCSSVGNCGIGGFYSDDAEETHAVVDDEIAGSWASAQQIPGAGALFGIDAQLTSVSCPADGDCSAGGWSGVRGASEFQAIVVNEVNGVWDNAEQVPGSGALNGTTNAQVTSVSCATPGNCVAGGFYDDAGFFVQPFVASEVNGTWGNAIKVPGAAKLNTSSPGQVTSVSCGAVANCALGGFYSNDIDIEQAFVDSEP